jgi:hypothetical protein
MPYENLTILISSFDKYAACWPPFCHGLNKYWPQHPDRVWFITNHLDAPCGKSLKLGEDQGWAANLLQALSLIETEFILYCQEDYWIKQPVPDPLIQDYLAHLEGDRVDYIRLYPAPGPDRPWDADHRLGVIDINAKYRTSLQMALWRKTTLLELLNPDESPWDFEVKGTKRSRAYDERFFCISKRRFGIDYVFTAIVNGYWSEKALDYATSERLIIAFDDLPAKSQMRRSYDHLRSVAYRVKRKITKNKILL